MLEAHCYPSVIGGFLRMLAHFDALDGDAEPDAPQPRYELLYPEDTWPGSPLVAALRCRLEQELLVGSSV